MTRKVREYELGGRGRVYVTGKLVKLPTPEAAGFTLRFDISRIDKLDRVVLPFQGEIKLGWFYSDTIQGGARPMLSRPLKMPMHHAGAIDWRNAASFPQLTQRGLRGLVFRAMSSTTQMIRERQWRTIYHLDIVEVK